MIETRDYKFTRANKHLTSGRIHDQRQIQRCNSIIHMYVRLAVRYEKSFNDLTTKQYKNYQYDILSVATLNPI